MSRRYPSGHPRNSKGYLYRAWVHMIDRCTRVTDGAFARYGGRGIVVCSRWLDSFDAFCDDVGERPSSAHTLDRINNDGSYEPDNVRWATRTEQVRNRRNTVKLGAVPLAEAATAAGVSYRCAYTRMYRGQADRALSVESLRARATCRRGHLRSGTNLYVAPDGRRICKTCRRLASGRYANRKKERTV